MSLPLRFMIKGPIPFDIDEATAFSIAQARIEELNKKGIRSPPPYIEICESEVNPIICNTKVSIHDNIKVWRFVIISNYSRI